jgi:signal transduction histidine kinase
MLEVMDVPDAGARGLAPVPDVAALSGLVDRLRAAGLPTTLTVEGDWVAVPGGVQLAVYRVVQEALTNVLRHASGATASVVARAQDGAVDVTVTDDGSGARRPGTSPGAGRGLVGMRERVAAHGGTLSAGPAPDGGFRVEARMPVAS